MNRPKLAGLGLGPFDVGVGADAALDEDPLELGDVGRR